MTLLIPAVVLIPIVFCLPAWIVARKRYGATPWSLNFAVPGMATWIVLATGGIGPQSLANIVELFIISLGAIPVYYLKVFYVDRIKPDPRLNTVVATVMLCVVAIVLRLAMPVLPE